MTINLSDPLRIRFTLVVIIGVISFTWGCNSCLLAAEVTAPSSASSDPSTGLEEFSPEFKKLIESERQLDEAVSKGKIVANSYHNEKIYDLANHPFFLEMQQVSSRAQLNAELDLALGATSFHTNELGPFLGWEPLSPIALAKLRYRLWGNVFLAGVLGQAIKTNESSRLGLGYVSQTIAEVLLQQPLFSGGDIRASFFRWSAGISGFSHLQNIPDQSYYLQSYWALQIGFGRVFVLTEQLAIGLEAFVRTSLNRANSFQNATEPKDGQGFQMINSFVYRPSMYKQQTANDRNYSYSLDLMYRAENFSVSPQTAVALGAPRLFLEQLMIAFSLKLLQ